METKHASSRLITSVWGEGGGGGFSVLSNLFGLEVWTLTPTLLFSRASGVGENVLGLAMVWGSFSPGVFTQFSRWRTTPSPFLRRLWLSITRWWRPFRGERPILAIDPLRFWDTFNQPQIDVESTSNDLEYLAVFRVRSGGSMASRKFLIGCLRKAE